MRDVSPGSRREGRRRRSPRCYFCGTQINDSPAQHVRASTLDITVIGMWANRHLPSVLRPPHRDLRMGAFALLRRQFRVPGAIGTFVGWALFQISMIMTANLSGGLTGEWKGALPPARRTPLATTESGAFLASSSSRSRWSGRYVDPAPVLRGRFYTTFQGPFSAPVAAGW